MVDSKEKGQTCVVTNREVKSSAFTTYFGEAEHAAQLYRALMELEHGAEENSLPSIEAEDIDFTTLSGVLFMARKNDLAFTVKKKVLVISEHQSTVNANMPLRGAIYYGRQIEKLIDPKALYRTGLISLPVPEFYVFYNGKDTYPKEQILKLSDAYLVKDGEPMLELKVKVININLSENHPVLSICRPLYEYAWFVQCIRNHMKQGKGRDQAIIQAMKECEEEGIMVEFIREHGTEAFNMLFTEFNMEDALEVRGEEKYSEGVERGLEQGTRVLAETCRELGVSREDTILRLRQNFPISEEVAGLCVDQCWKSKRV